MIVGKWCYAALALLGALICFVGGFPVSSLAAQVSSDVDRYISGVQSERPNPQRWAVIIGIEKYQHAVGAPFARQDAQSVKEYAQKLLGVPQENAFLLLDEQATKTNLQVLLEERLPRRLKPGDQLFVYYAGHGLADPRTGQPYLLPNDGDPQSIQLSGYSAEAFYGALGRLKEQQVFVFLDACFSGIVGRQEKVEPLLLAARPLVLTAEDPALKHSNVTVLAAAQHDQLSNADTENGHGLFTYQLLRGLVGEADANRDGRVRLGELASYVKESVDRKSRQLYGQTRDQTPVLTPARLDTRQNIELTSRTGKMPAEEKPAVATKLEPRTEKPPLPPIKSKPSQDLREFKVEVDSLQVAGEQVVVFLRMTNKTPSDLGIILGRTRPFVTDNKGSLCSLTESSGIGWISLYGDKFAYIPSYAEHTISMRFYDCGSRPQRASIYSVSLEVIFASQDTIERMRPGYGLEGARTANVSIRGVEAE